MWYKWYRRLLQWLNRLFHNNPQTLTSPPQIPAVSPSGGLTFYTVYIPTLDGRFDYLGVQDYAPGEIVAIPFGPEDRQVFGIVEKVQVHPYGKAPLPMWKMKYILGKAPQAVIEEYRRLKKD